MFISRCPVCHTPESPTGNNLLVAKKNLFFGSSGCSYPEKVHGESQATPQIWGPIIGEPWQSWRSGDSMGGSYWTSWGGPPQRPQSWWGSQKINDEFWCNFFPVSNSFETLLVLIKPTNTPESELVTSPSGLASFIKEVFTIFCDVDNTHLLECDNNTKTIDSVVQFLKTNASEPREISAL